MQEIDPALTKRRSAFTLIEILIVIAIIAILASLLLGAVVAVRRRIPETTTRNDILQLSTAMNAFYAKYKFYPPNQLKLCSNRTSYNNAVQLDIQSVAAITKMFPNINWTGIMWDGATHTTVTLEGDQCLVFFLGGIPNGAGQPPQGFMTNPAFPAPTAAVTLASSPDRIKFMNSFDASRIVPLHPAATSKHFPSYLDGFAANLPLGAAAPPLGANQKQPYLYFSSTGFVTRENGYDTATSLPAGYNVLPYMQQAAAPAKYWNSTTFQIISAGADGTFGPGGLWPPAQAHGMDDMSNFNSSVLSAPD